MNLLSKPYKITFRLIEFYFQQLFMHPIRTKSISSCFISGLGNYISQRLSGERFINHDTFWAFTIFGLIFGGAIPHYFNEIFSDFLSENSVTSLLQVLVIERLVFMPAYTLFTLYMLSRLEGNGHENSFDSALKKFPSIFEANLKYLNLLQYINIFFVPPILRVLFSDLINFFWIIYLSRKRQHQK